MKFRSDVAGVVTGVRFYKGDGNTGTHTGNLWTADGTLLATATFTNETATGWQQVSFSSPVAIAANTTYVVSYYAPDGRYAADGSYFAAAGVDNAPAARARRRRRRRTACTTTAPSGFPTDSFSATNYWVDVVFATTAGDTTPPTVASTVPAGGAVGVAAGSTVTATFSEAIQPGDGDVHPHRPREHRGARDRELRRRQRPFDPHAERTPQQQHPLHGPCERCP